MRHDQNHETASGAGYERLMNRMKADTCSVFHEPSSFASKKTVDEETDGRAQFGKRRAFEG